MATEERVEALPAPHDAEAPEGDTARQHLCRRPVRGRAEARRRLGAALVDVIERLVEDAKCGSVAHVKLYMELSGLDKGSLGRVAKRRVEKALEDILIEQWERDAKQRNREHGDAKKEGMDGV